MWNNYDVMHQKISECEQRKRDRYWSGQVGSSSSSSLRREREKEEERRRKKKANLSGGKWDHRLV